MCSSRKNPYPNHWRSLEISRGGGLKSQHFRSKVWSLTEISLGGGWFIKQTSMGGVMDMSWNYTIRKMWNMLFKPHSVSRKVFIYSWRFQVKNLWCLICIHASNSIPNQCKYNVHFPTELRPIFKLLLKWFKWLYHITKDPLNRYSDSTRWLVKSFHIWC